MNEKFGVMTIRQFAKIISQELDNGYGILYDFAVVGTTDIKESIEEVKHYGGWHKIATSISLNSL